jgi:hypothetical protein
MDNAIAFHLPITKQKTVREVARRHHASRSGIVTDDIPPPADGGITVSFRRRHGGTHRFLGSLSKAVTAASNPQHWSLRFRVIHFGGTSARFPGAVAPVHGIIGQSCRHRINAASERRITTGRSPALKPAPSRSFRIQLRRKKNIREQHPRVCQSIDL